MASVTASADSVLMNSATISYSVSASLPDKKVHTYSKYIYEDLTYSWTFSPGDSTASNASGTKKITGLTAGAATTITGTVKVTCTCEYYTRTKNKDGSYTDWEYEDSFTHNIKTESDSVTVYTRPGTFAKFSNISIGDIIQINRDEKDSKNNPLKEGLSAKRVNEWCDHCNKYLSWKNQATSTAANNCKVETGDLITADWYNKCARTCGLIKKNGKDLVKGSYIDNSTDPPTYYPGDLITAERIKALGAAISS